MKIASDERVLCQERLDTSFFCVVNEYEISTFYEGKKEEY